ncbi:MAG: phosphoenolpyruvate--protein phosphotransferase [Deltaproteobacteria bacterium]|nr:phosphoenolpyruvate--protein phosphotransferase [Deltaproteobacteria bacterium]
MSDKDSQEIRLVGIGGSPGICIGKAYLVDREGVDVVERYPIARKDIKEEINRFKAAVKGAKDELLAVIEDTPEELRQHAYVLETHIQLLKDKMLYGSTIEAIEKEQVNAEWAFKKTVSRVKSMFQNMTNAYLRERASDIVHVADRIMLNLMGGKPVNIKDIRQRVILIAPDLSPAETSQINLKRIMGFVTDRGGKASHTSIIARTLEIPAVLGLANATRVINNDNIVIVDGSAGIVIINPTEETLFEFEERKLVYEEFRSVLVKSSHLDAETKDGIRLRVMGNIEFPEEAETTLDYGGDGIGLYRTEFQYLSRPTFPNENELFEKYKVVVEKLNPKPVTIRTLDINGDKAIASEANAQEENPALGLRAIRYCLKKTDVFKTQLRAILRAAAFGNLRLIFPMISSIDEIIEAKRILAETAQELSDEGLAFNADIPVGIMIEVPSAVILASQMAELVDFFSIGTNDLIQYSLAIDRNNKEVAYLYNPLHPAILRMLKTITDVGKEKGIPIYICGEMAGDRLALETEDTRKFVESIMDKQSSSEIMNMVEKRFGSILYDTIDTTT